MATLLSFLPFIQPQAPGVPIPTVLQEVRVALADFAAVTRLWRHRKTAAVTEDDQDYVVVTPDGTVMHDIETAWFDGQEVEVKAVAKVSPEDLASQADRPLFITQTLPQTIRLVPRATGTLDLLLFLKPSVDPSAPQPVIPDFFVAEHGQAIGHAALFGIKTLPGQPYSDPAAAAVHRAVYIDARDRLTGSSIRGQMRAPMRARGRYV